MSIWCSWQDIGFEDPRWEPRRKRPNGGQVRSYATGWSNHYPTTVGDVEREAYVDLASIPVWCVPGREERYDETYGPWLRLGVHTAEHNYKAPHNVVGEVDAMVVMDERAVRALRDQLTRWLDHPKTQPARKRTPAAGRSREMRT